MAVNATAVYRVRAGGNDVNGGGYDSAISGALATTLNGSISSGTTTVVVASATGWPTSGNYYAQIGAAGAEPAGANPSSEIVLVTGGQGTTSWTVTRGQLGTTAVAFASGIAVTNDISRCNTAAASGTAGASTASTTFTDATFAAFSLAHVGMCIWLASGTGSPTVGAYYITAVGSGGASGTATSVTLDRASGTYTAGVWKLGGAWANVQTNVSTTYIVPGNTVYVRGAGTDSPSPGAPDYTHATASLPSGSNSTGFINYIGEYGRPALKGSTNTIFTTSAHRIINMYLVGAATGATAMVVVGSPTLFNNVVFNQNGFDQTCCSGATFGAFIGCEFLNSGSAPAAANNALTLSVSIFIKNCNVHNLTSGFISTTATNALQINSSIFSNLGADCITLGGVRTSAQLDISGNTFDAGAGHGIVFGTAAGSILDAVIENNLFTNFNQAGKYAINGSFNTLAVNDRLKGIIDYNTFYNNTANYNAITAGANDTQLSADPYVSQSTQDYRLATALVNGVGYPTAAYPQHSSGKTGPRSYVSPGAVVPLPRGIQVVA